MMDTTVSAQIREILKDNARGAMPVWIRPPVRGQEYWTSLTRAKLYELHSRGKIRSVSIREPGRVKGCRLFHLQSILDYIAGLEQAAVEQQEVAA